jgi:murein DD-endopeptidase MepM/ murein hydrolase activator NlpD
MNRFPSFRALAGAVTILAGVSATSEAVTSGIPAQITDETAGVPDFLAEKLPDAPPEPAFPDVFPVSLKICPVMYVFNRPKTDEDLVMVNYAPVVSAGESVKLATAPVAEGCLSSGFGMRRTRLHEGVDYFNQTAVDIYAAGNGVIKEMTYRNDFGNMIVIDHGDGVFTRYAHLERFSGLKEGAAVEAGDVIGLMGNTSSRKIARHLHFEVLTGEWGDEAGSFALTPLDVFDLPAADTEG